MNIVEHNQDAWNRLADNGYIWSTPLTSEEVANAGRGIYTILLTPRKTVPHEWIGDVKGKSVLCLASGGGQQGPVFAALGADVVVFDNSPSQLEKDSMVADRDGLSIRTVQGDMRDLSAFADESFDLIFHPVSNCFVDEIQPVWNECYRILKYKGILLSGFANPVAYIFDFERWDREGIREVKYRIPYSDTTQLPREQLDRRLREGETLEFGHSLESQLGGQIKAGFLLNGFYEDSGEDMLDGYIDTLIATRAVKFHL